MKKFSSLIPSYSDMMIFEEDKTVKEAPSLQIIKNASYIVKTNSLIEARYRLSLQESHVILWLLTQIKPNDEDFKIHELDIAEFAKFTGVQLGNRYSELRKITRQLMQRVIEIYEPNVQELLQISWLSSARYQHKKGCVRLKFDPDLKPYLLQLKEKFTKINIADTLKLKSSHTIRVFELLLQYVLLGSRTISIVDLRSYCGLQQNQYKNYFDLKRKIIEKAKTEINSKTEYDIDYTEIKQSRKVVAIEWTIKKKDLDKESRIKRIKILEKELRSESVLIASMIDYGYSKMMAKRLIKNHGEEAVKQAIRVVNIQIEKGKAKNPKALLWSALAKDWKPDVYTPHDR